MNEEKMSMGGKWYGGRKRWFLIPVFIIAMVLLMSFFVMLMWNALVPHLFPSVPAVNYCQAIILLVLCKILFGGFRKGGGGWERHRHARAWKEKWMNMSEEERAKFKEEWKNRCC